MSKILSSLKTIQKITSKNTLIISNRQFLNFFGDNKNNKNIFYSNKVSNFSTEEDQIDPNAEKVKFTFHHLNGNPDVEVEAPVGRNILRVAHDNKIDLEGACDCSLACSTCHVIFTKDVFDNLDESKEEEEDLLDLAFGLTETSRLGCQVIVSKLLERTTITIPAASRNIQ